LCLKSVKDGLINSLKEAVKEFYGEDAQKSQDYSRIISERHFDRVSGLLTAGQAVFGGRTDRGDLFIEPTILDEVQTSDGVMQEEIFGPILPIITVRNVDEAIEFINEREKPLALYIFSNNRRVVNQILEQTSSGGVTVNDCLLHVTLDTLPFGGVGNSGTGRYHGQYSFNTFTHEKAVLDRPESGERILWMRYPPYNEGKFYWAKIVSKKHSVPALWFIEHVPLFLLGLLIGYLLQHFGLLNWIWTSRD
jgi:acyl-CoA reductase-like NAD-dependent aldehyde dehydrogenase